MPVDRKIIKEVDMIENLKQLTVVYEEIAVMRIYNTKNTVLHTREFFNRLENVYFNIKSSYNKKLLHMMNSKVNVMSLEMKSSKKNGKEVHALLSANNKLYGDIISLVFQEFLQKTAQISCDLVVLGEVGKTMYDGQQAKKPYTYFPISDSGFDPKQVKAITDFLKVYSRVYIYYGKFISVLRQDPAINDISGSQPFAEEKKNPQEYEPYLFEPNLQHVHSAFEEQIFYALFTQTVHEIELARHASRIKAMEKTNENIEVRLNSLKHKQKVISAMTLNKRQLGQLASIKYFKKRRLEYAER